MVQACLARLTSQAMGVVIAVLVSLVVFPQSGYVKYVLV